jgi:predicted nuclease of restriction endonuclease-like (RecB) superfamily
MRDLPWGHIVTITAKATEDARDWYAERAAAWSQEQLEAAIATRLHQRQAAAIINFGRTLEAGDAAAVPRITRDPLILDFVELAESARERDLEAALLSDTRTVMLALGEGFYFAGRQRSLPVGGEEFILDLLIYHHPTRRGLLMMSVLIALIGIINTLSLAIIERRRELGLLRVIGMTDHLVERMVRIESLLIAALGTLSGVVLGIFTGWALIHAIDRLTNASVHFNVPYGTIGLVLALGVVLGVLAALLPARRSTRLDLLDALQTT